MSEILKIGKLDNGLSYILNPDKKFSSCCIYIYIRVGSKQEQKNQYGMAHFLEHILFKGTKKYKTNIELNKKIDSLTGNTNASTSKNFTNYFLKLPSKNLEEGLDLLKEMVFCSILNLKELEKEKDVVLEEMNKTFDDSEDFIEDLLPYYIFKNSQLSHYILGNREIIKNMKRKDIYKFYKKYYIPSNSLLVISGNFSLSIEKKLSKIFNLKNVSPSINHIYEQFNFLKKPQIISKYREHSQITIGYAFPLFNLGDDRKYCLDILMSYLDGFMTSKLWLELREKNPLVYNADADYELFEEGGIFQIKYSLEKKNVFRSIEIIYNILESLKKNLDNKEFQIFKKNTILNKELEKDEIIDKCEFYGENYLFNNKLVLYKDIKKKYELCSKKNIIDLSNYIFDYNKMVIIQMGDINKKTFENKVNKIFNFEY